MRFLLIKPNSSSLWLLFCMTWTVVFSQTPDKLRKKKSSGGYQTVLEMPYQYDCPTLTPLKTSKSTGKAWVVYSDRNANVTYGDASLATPLLKANFLDSFYVTKQTAEAVEIIKCTAGLLLQNSLKLADPNKFEYMGWIDKSKLMLSEKSFVDAGTRRPYKNVTILSSIHIFDKVKSFADGEKIMVFDGPDSHTGLTKDLNFDEVVYVYKKNKDKVLIGKKPRCSKSDATKVIIGWVHADFVKSWGQRLCLQPKETVLESAKQVFIYPIKDHAFLLEQNVSIGLPLMEQKCSKPDNEKWRSPVLKIEPILKGKEKYNLIHTGVPTPTFDKSKSFIYNVKGAKIPYAQLCEIVSTNKKVNIVFVINAGNDTKEYLNVLVNTLQELAGFFISKKEEYTFKYGATDCGPSLNNVVNTGLVNQYSDIVPTLINIVRSSVEGKNNTSMGMVAGLGNAVRMFRGKEDESNVIVMVSSQADPTAETTNKALKDAVISDLAKYNARLLMFQPYCGSSPSYSNFVQQAKSFIKSSAEKIGTYKREKQVSNNASNNVSNSFKTIRSGTNNVYCLDYPSDANFQGFMVFPTIGNNIDDKYLNESLDSLLSQIERDNEMSTKALRDAFNSPSSFNNIINSPFQRHYATLEPLPSDISYYLKNMDYNYYIEGFLAYPSSGTKPFQYTLLLSGDEYDDHYQTFKNLQFNLISPAYDIKSRTSTYYAMQRTLQRYSKERELAYGDNCTLSTFFQIITGYVSSDKLLNKYKVSDLKNISAIAKDDVKPLVDYINYRLSSFYALRNQSRSYFLSNGQRYYWVSESSMP